MNYELNKPDRLLRMLEQPQRYSADEWQEILADEECRELYTLMSKTQSAIDAARADETVTDEMIEAEWQWVKMKNEKKKSERSLLKIAATFIGVLMLSGIAFAAISIVSMNKAEVGEDLQSQTHETQTDPSHQQAADNEQPADTIPQTRIFENAPLDEIITEIALYYNKVADIQSEQAHELRIYYKWNRKNDIESIVEDLNHFDHVNLVVEAERLTVKP